MTAIIALSTCQFVCWTNMNSTKVVLIYSSFSFCSWSSFAGAQIKIWFQNRRTKWKKQDPNTAAELAQLKSASRVSKSKSGSDRSQQDAAAISAGEMSDAATNISSAPVSPSPPV